MKKNEKMYEELNWLVVAVCEAKNNARIEKFNRVIAAFENPVNAQGFIDKVLPQITRDRFTIIRKEDFFEKKHGKESEKTSENKKLSKNIKRNREYHEYGF